jgi:hypothetical protein
MNVPNLHGVERKGPTETASLIFGLKNVAFQQRPLGFLHRLGDLSVP